MAAANEICTTVGLVNVIGQHLGKQIVFYRIRYILGPYWSSSDSVDCWYWLRMFAYLKLLCTVLIM